MFGDWLIYRQNCERCLILLIRDFLSFLHFELTWFSQYLSSLGLEVFKWCLWVHVTKLLLVLWWHFRQVWKKKIEIQYTRQRFLWRKVKKLHCYKGNAFYSWQHVWMEGSTTCTSEQVIKREYSWVSYDPILELPVLFL